MVGKSSTASHAHRLILAAEREAQMVSAFARLAIITIAMTIFLLSGGINLPVAPIVLTYLGSYALVSIVSGVFSLKRFFSPRMSLLFTAIDGISLALLIGFALLVTGSPMKLHGAVPGFVFIFSILILATMRYTIGPTLVAFLSFGATWFLFSLIVDYGLLKSPLPSGSVPEPNFFFGTVQNAARWGFLAIATILCLLAVTRRRKTLEAAINAANKTANLSRYLPDRVAKLVAEQGIDALSSGGKQNAAVLFVDIRGFTGISEQVEPQELSAMLSEFRSIVSLEVEAHFGIVDKFIGDAVMAVFGVPDERSDDADCGIKCAVGIIDKMKVWNEERREAFQPPILITIGVHCGEVFAGAVGAENRMEFTVVGDTVNIAARLQEAAKNTESGLVVSQTLLERSGSFNREDHAWNALNESSIRGRQGKVVLYSYISSPEGDDI
jgi:adenylate cyclase